jgi:GDP-L-fucose synthase
VINAAGKVGGILDNSKYPIDYLNKNILIGLNIINISYKYKIKTVINLGSACIYPKITKLPIKEDYLLSSYLEKTNEAYALAKIVTLKLCEYYKKIKKKNFISLQPANLYGDNDNYDLKSSHVIPALIRKFCDAKLNKKPTVRIWGSGKNKREFMHVNDLANAIFFLLKKNIKEYYLNIGTNEEISIKELANKIKIISKFKGKIIFDKNKPDGQKRRVLDSTKIKKIGWKNKISLDKGLSKVYINFEKKYNFN